MTDAQRLLQLSYSLHGLKMDEEGVVRSDTGDIVARVTMGSVRLEGDALQATVVLPAKLNRIAWSSQL